MPFKLITCSRDEADEPKSIRTGMQVLRFSGLRVVIPGYRKLPGSVSRFLIGSEGVNLLPTLVLRFDG